MMLKKESIILKNVMSRFWGKGKMMTRCGRYRERIVCGGYKKRIGDEVL